ncbi:hypothetical protein [Glaciimonas sp. PAMC28666]|uniref:hypothetical protein n=1 Tax=Glaciimonas sp. PAMC28666 TaxID=2807626 RepID=UPI00196459E9|nr:hypothetical protein [Glaciimonas sp. PAMC28666]QRX84133.1 hypothetical protein JQN73_08055 [Glaciimonas sp. PAMC28666]
MLIIKSLCKLCRIRSMLCGMTMLFLFGMGQADALSNQPLTAQPLTAQPATAASGDAQIGTYSAQTRADDWGNPWPDKGTWNLPDEAPVNLHRVDNPPGARFRLPGMSRVDTTAIKVSMRSALPGGSFGGWHEELIDLGGPTTETRFEAYIEESRKWTPGVIVEIMFKPLEGNLIAKSWSDVKQFRMTAQPKPGVWRFPADNILQDWSGTLFQIGGSSSAVAGEAAATGLNAGVNKITVSTKKNSEAEVEESRNIAAIQAGAAFTFDISEGKKWRPGDTVEVKFKVWRDGIASDWSPSRIFYSGGIPVQWISPGINSWYGPSADNLFKVSGRTDPAVDQVDVGWCSADHKACGRTLFQNVRVGADGIFRDVVVPASKDWIIGTDYLVTMTVKRRGQTSDASPERRFRTRFLADWVSPAAGSEYWPVTNGPFILGGKTEAGTQSIEIRSRANYVGQWTVKTHPVKLDSYNAFNVAVDGSTDWLLGNRHVQFRGIRNGIGQDWSSLRSFKVMLAPVTQRWISPDDNSHYVPLARYPLRVKMETDPGVNEILIESKLQSQSDSAATRTRIKVAPAEHAGVIYNFAVSESVNWQAGQRYEVKFKVSRGGVSAVDWSTSRTIYAPYTEAPTRLDWISPDEGSQYIPAAGQPLTISGTVDPGVDTISTQFRIQGGNYGSAWHSVPVKIDSANKFSAVPIPDSVNWEAGKHYEVRFFSGRDGVGSAAWSASRTIQVPYPALSRLDWISPDEGSQYIPAAGQPLTISGTVDPGVDTISTQFRIQGGNYGSAWHSVPVKIDSANKFSAVPIPDSVNWEEGKRYEVRFFSGRDGVGSAVWSTSRTILVPYSALKRLDWISPDNGSAYAPSPGNSLKISGKVDPGVNWISTHIKLQGSADEGRQNFAVAVTLDSENVFRDMPVLKSDQWEEGKTYEVKFASWRDNDQSADWSQTRTFHVPYTYPTKVEWISPADGSAYTPLTGHPLLISGSTDPGVNQVAVWWQEIDAKNRGAYSPPIDVILDSNNEFNNVPVTGSESWKEGKTYDVQFKVLRPGPLASNWSSVRKIHVPVKIPGQPTWISPATDSWQRPSQEQPLVIRGNAIAGVEEIKVFWKNEKDHESGATGYLKIDAQEEDGSFSFKFAESEKWSHDSAYEVWFSVKRLGAESVISTPRRFLVDRLAPTLSELTQSMSDDGHYTLSGTAIDAQSGLGFNGDGNAAMVIRWRTDDATPWSEGTTLDVSAAGEFLFGLTAEQLNKSWTVQVEMTATDRVGNVLTQLLVPYVTRPVVKLDVNRVKWTPAPNTADSRSLPGVSEGGRPANASGSEMFAGDTFSYSVNVIGKKGKAENLNLTYTLPPELEMHGVPVLTMIAKNSAMLNSEWNGTEEHAQLLIAGASLGAADGFNISIPLRVRADAVTSTESRITLHADGLPDSSFSDVVILVPYQGALKLVKSVNKDSAKEGDTLEYTIRFSNTSASFIVMEEIHDPIDPRMRLVNLTCGEDLPPDLICSISESETTAVWKFSGRLPAGGSGAVGYSTTITPPDNQESR